MTYSERMWEEYVQVVSKMWSQGYMVHEIARVLESSEELVSKVVEKYCPGMARE